MLFRSFGWATDVLLAIAWSISSTILARSTAVEDVWAKRSDEASKSIGSAYGIQTLAVSIYEA